MNKSLDKSTTSKRAIAYLQAGGIEGIKKRHKEGGIQGFNKIYKEIEDITKPKTPVITEQTLPKPPTRTSKRAIAYLQAGGIEGFKKKHKEIGDIPKQPKTPVFRVQRTVPVHKTAPTRGKGAEMRKKHDEGYNLIFEWDYHHPTANYAERVNQYTKILDKAWKELGGVSPYQAACDYAILGDLSEV